MRCPTPAAFPGILSPPPKIGKLKKIFFFLHLECFGNGQGLPGAGSVLQLCASLIPPVLPVGFFVLIFFFFFPESTLKSHPGGGRASLGSQERSPAQAKIALLGHWQSWAGTLAGQGPGNLGSHHPPPKDGERIIWGLTPWQGGERRIWGLIPL